MSELVHFPFVNQLDGSENAEFNCVPASLSACIRYLTGQTVTPDRLKDAAYGPAWANTGTAADAYVSVCARYGVRLYPVENASVQEAIQQAHALLAQGLPVVFTQQDDYAPSQYRDSWTHVCVWYADAPNALTAMDPFGGKQIMYTDAVWASRLRSNEVWSMEKGNTMQIPTGWSDDGSVLTAPNNIQIRTGFRNYVLNNNWNPNNWPLQSEQGLNPLEVSNASLGGGTQQIFRWTVLEWTSTRGTFVAWSGAEILALRNMILTLQNQNKSLQAQMTQVQQSQSQNVTVSSLKTALQQIYTIVSRYQ